MKLLPDDLCMALIKYLESKPIGEAVVFWDRLRQLPEIPIPPKSENN